MSLLQTCKLGTLNFSHLARCGFIASSFLKSFVSKGIISEEEKTAQFVQLDCSAHRLNIIR